LGELFDLRLYGQEIRLKRMQEEISRLQERIQKRKENKAKIVKARLQQMTGEAESWEW